MNRQPESASASHAEPGESEPSSTDSHRFTQTRQERRLGLEPRSWPLLICGNLCSSVDPLLSVPEHRTPTTEKRVRVSRGARRIRAVVHRFTQIHTDRTGMPVGLEAPTCSPLLPIRVIRAISGCPLFLPPRRRTPARFETPILAFLHVRESVSICGPPLWPAKHAKGRLHHGGTETTENARRVFCSPTPNTQHRSSVFPLPPASRRLPTASPAPRPFRPRAWAWHLTPQAPHAEGPTVVARPMAGRAGRGEEARCGGGRRLAGALCGRDGECDRTGPPEPKEHRDLAEPSCSRQCWLR